jgi:hypothetical protein
MRMFIFTKRAQTFDRHCAESKSSYEGSTWYEIFVSLVATIFDRKRQDIVFTQPVKG